MKRNEMRLKCQESWCQLAHEMRIAEWELGQCVASIEQICKEKQDAFLPPKVRYLKKRLKAMEMDFNLSHDYLSGIMEGLGTDADKN